MCYMTKTHDNQNCMYNDECTNASWSRGLCGTHYHEARRHGELEEYPTTKFLANPEAHINWAFGYQPELIGDVAIQYGYRLVKVD